MKLNLAHGKTSDAGLSNAGIPETECRGQTRQRNSVAGFALNAGMFQSRYGPVVPHRLRARGNQVDNARARIEIHDACERPPRNQHIPAVVRGYVVSRVENFPGLLA